MPDFLTKNVILFFQNVTFHNFKMSGFVICQDSLFFAYVKNDPKAVRFEFVFGGPAPLFEHFCVSYVRLLLAPSSARRCVC